VMQARRTTTLPELERATPSEIEEALVHFDELDAPSLERLENHPVHGRRLAVLREAEAWLAEAGPEALATTPCPSAPCPSAEGLYDFGAGPGSSSLPTEERARIAEHLERCAGCRELVATLASPPPLPLELSEPPPLSIVRGGAPPRRSWRPRRVALVAAAAGLLFAALALPGWLADPLERLPRTPIYRGAESQALLYPRGPLLDRGARTPAVVFELAPVEGAESYRVELYRHDGGAFEVGDLVATHEAATPRLEHPALAAGRYTWRAWASLRGLERDLGSRDFEVRANQELAERLERLGADSSVKEIVEEVRALDSAGFVVDARALARTLPASEARDDYLSPPGR